jgi:hypothetical protein
VLLSDEKSSNHARFLFPLVTKRGNRRENNNTLAGGIKAVPAADHGSCCSCAFIPEACAGNGVPQLGHVLALIAGASFYKGLRLPGDQYLSFLSIFPLVFVLLPGVQLCCFI